MESHIDVTLVYKGVEKDIRIPTKIEVGKLIRELDKIFDWSSKRRKYQIRVLNKGLLLDEGKVLADFPLTRGDLIEIEEV